MTWPGIPGNNESTERTSVPLSLTHSSSDLASSSSSGDQHLYLLAAGGSCLVSTATFTHHVVTIYLTGFRPWPLRHHRNCSPKVMATARLMVLKHVPGKKAFINSLLTKIETQLRIQSPSWYGPGLHFSSPIAHSQRVPRMTNFSLHPLVPETLFVLFPTLGHLSHQSPMSKTYLTFKGLAAMPSFFQGTFMAPESRSCLSPSCPAHACNLPQCNGTDHYPWHAGGYLWTCLITVTRLRAPQGLALILTYLCISSSTLKAHM